MLFFPKLYEDELLYSVIARYHQYSGNENFKHSLNESFGSSTICSTLFFPSSISNLLNNLPHHSFTSNDIINNHTILPYYKPWIPINRYTTLINKMVNGKGSDLYMLLGRTASSIKSKQSLYYCEDCVKFETKMYGEAYWHRTHQLDGVLVCHIHKKFLIKSTVDLRKRTNKHSLFTLDNSIEINDSNRTAYSGDDFNHLLTVAEQSYALLEPRFTALTPEKLRVFYVSKLREMELLTLSGNIRWDKLIPSFTIYYGDNVLKEWKSNISIGAEDTWLHKVLRKPRGSCHPLRHILLISFLGETVESLLTKMNIGDYNPFGVGPWPCLNKGAEHYKEDKITTVKITRDSKSSQPVGTFRCSCGFSYSRKGPDIVPEDRHRIGRIKEFGDVWREKLKEINQSDLSLRKKAELLGVDPKTVINQWQKDTQINNHAEFLSCDKKQEYKQQWLKLINAGLSISELRKNKSNLYMWLYRNDKEWLKEHSPQKIRRKNKESIIDWEQRDIQLAELAKSIVKDILNELKIQRVTKNEIGRRMGRINLLYKYMHKLPKTKLLLENSLESIEQFQMRRIKEAVKKLTLSESVVKEWEVIRKAGLKPKYANKHKQFITSEIIASYKL
ncbi:TnsD family transposase [Sutcliffiella horikoshii]|uniref:TnsD family transposase n=1 Tax=Sutcliffiella horikoshii TaxID=79883 RepID=UPI001CFC8832|nr:TnsD family transposase [Sutcliffiella horikoshii]